jgi:hypothetical protein
MLRTLLVVFVLLGLLVGWCCAQAPGGEAETAPVAESQTAPLPDLSDQAVTGEAVVDLADFICGCLNDSGAIPDWSQVQTVNGRLRRVSAAEVFALLARTVYLWNDTGELPATVPLAPQEVNPPQLDAEDLPGDQYDPEAGSDIPTEDFLAWCADTVYWIDRLHTIPTAVWLDGQRLSAAQYLAGLAICIQYAYYEGDLLDYIFLPQYAPPSMWVGAFQGEVAEEEYAEETSDVEAAASQTLEGEWEEEAPASPAQARALEERAPVSYPNPTLVLLPEPGQQVSGVVDVLAVYSGPPAGYAMFGVDGQTKAMTNSQPYGYRWDTSTLAPGPHTLRVRFFAEDDTLLIDQVSVYTVTAPKPAAGEAAK